MCGFQPPRNLAAPPRRLPAAGHRDWRSGFSQTSCGSKLGRGAGFALLQDQPMTNNGCPNSTGWPFWLWPPLRGLTFATLTLANADTGRVLAVILLMVSSYDEQRLSKLYWLAVFNQDGLDDAALVRIDLVEQLHCLDDAQSVAAVHGLADVHERLGTRGRRAVEGANHRRFHHMAFGDRRLGGFGNRRRGGNDRLLRGRRIGLHHGRGGACDANAFFALADLQFGNAGTFYQLNKCLEFAQIHDDLLKLVSCSLVRIARQIDTPPRPD